MWRRAAQLLCTGQTGCRRSSTTNLRRFSDKASEGSVAEAHGGAGGATTSGRSSDSSRLFENVAPLPEPEPVSGAAGRAGPTSKLFAALSNAVFYTFLGGATVAGYYQYAYDTDELSHIVQETKKEKNAFAGSSLWVPAMEWYLQQRRSVEERVREFSEPPSDKLLPDLPPQLKYVKTLVIDLDDVLVHADWTRERGWRSFKRPGVEEFIKNLAQYYELVLYTDQHAQYADPILDRLDPNKYISYRLYRNSTYYTDGKHARDLSKLNRDLSRVLFISCKPDAYMLQPENTIKLECWKLDASDTTLLDLMPFLEAVVRTNVVDVRDVVASYEGLHIPTAFRERMARVQSQQRSKQVAPRGLLPGLRKTAAT